MRVDGGCEGRHLPRKSLRQEKVPAGSVDVGDRGVPQRVEGVEPVEPRFHLPRPEGELDSALAERVRDWEQKRGSFGCNPSDVAGLVPAAVTSRLLGLTDDFPRQQS